MKRWRLLRQKTYGATEVLFLSAIGNQNVQSATPTANREQAKNFGIE
jgi:hypothetical protein